MWSVFLLNAAHPTTHMQRRKALFLFYIAFPPQYSPIRIRTGVSGFKVPSDNHYTIGAYKHPYYLHYYIFIHLVARSGVRTHAADATRS